MNLRSSNVSYYLYKFENFHYNRLFLTIKYQQECYILVTYLSPHEKLS